MTKNELIFKINKEFNKISFSVVKTKADLLSYVNKVFDSLSLNYKSNN